MLLKIFYVIFLDYRTVITFVVHICCGSGVWFFFVLVSFLCAVCSC
jgi:hypothetical protein